MAHHPEPPRQRALRGGAPPLIPKNTARRYAHQGGVDLDIAQQDIVLTYALDKLRAEGLLEHLVFKGGTYLRKMILGTGGRFSMDLDFTSTTTDVTLEDVASAMEGTHHGVQFSIQDSEATQNGYLLNVRYSHDWGEGNFKLDVSTRDDRWLPPEDREPKAERYFNDLPFEPPTIPCMDLHEALAEKIRALHQRKTERDLYDIIQYGDGALNEPLVRLLAVLKLREDGERFDPSVVLSKLEDGRRDWIDLPTLVSKQDDTNWNEECRKARDRFAFLEELTAFDERVRNDRYAHALDQEIQQRLRELQTTM